MPEIKDGMQAVDQNIQAVHRVRQTSDASRKADQKFIDLVASFCGSTRSLYIHLAFYGVGLTALAFGVPALQISSDDLKVNLGLTATLEAIFLSIFVLINQRRMNSVERKNSDLHLQMSLLVEHELTRLARVVDAMAKKMGVAGSATSLEDVKKDVHPDAILDRIAAHETSAPTDSTDDKK